MRPCKGYIGGPAKAHGGTQAYYRPSVDTVRIPEPSRTASSEEHYSVLFHEMTYSTGHRTRIDRKLDSDPQPFGSPEYGQEKLVAEMG